MTNKSGKKRKTTEKVCEYCNESFIAHNTLAKFCSPNCKQDNFNEKQRKKTLEDIKNALEVFNILEENADSKLIESINVERAKIKQLLKPILLSNKYINKDLINKLIKE